MSRLHHMTIAAILALSLSTIGCQSNPSQSELGSLGPAVVEPEAPETALASNSTGTDFEATASTTSDTESEVTAVSQSSSVALAQHLTATGVKMYGAYWCPHCQDQKATFGDAFSQIDYVECDPEGENPRTQMCLEADIEAFPTWVINGEHHLGAYSLEELAALSGFEGEEF